MSVDSNRAQAVFRKLVEAADPASHASILDVECADDAELRQLVEELLEAHDSAASREPTTIRSDSLHGSDQTVAISVGQDDRPTRILESGEDSAETSAAVGEDQPSLEFLDAAGKPGSLGKLGHYEVLELLGQGGFGIVLRAFDEKLQRVVAIKVLSPQLASTSPARKRFLREARNAARVRHENIVQIYAVEERPLPYLVMEYIPGQTLQQKLNEKGPLELAEIVSIGAQVARGLAAAHQQGLIHRDVKPGNILIESGLEPKVKITDFGLARTADDASVSQSGLISGTPLYMAPEQAKGATLDYRVDLFSLGSVLYTMASGRPPFRAGTTLAVMKRVTEEEPRPIQEIIPEVPAWLCNLIARLHVKDPALRWQSAAELADLLSRHLAHLQQPTLIPRPESIGPPAASRPWLVRALAVVALVLLVAAGVAYSVWGPGRRPTVALRPTGPAPTVAAKPVISDHYLQGRASVRDALLSFDEPERNLGSVDRDNALRRGENQVNALLVRFDLANLDLPPLARVEKAFVSFFVWDPSSQGKAKLAAFPLSSAWDEASVTWRQRAAGQPWNGADFVLGVDTGPPGAAVVVDPEQGSDTLDPPREYQLDVTDLVRAWLINPASNFGLAIAPVIDAKVDQGIMSRFQVYGSENWRVQYTPKLTVQTLP